MKKGIIAIAALLLVVCTSCFKDNDYKMTEFFLVNKCDQTLTVTSNAWIIRFDGDREEVTLIDNIPCGATFSMRRLEVTEGFSMSSVFSRMEIRKGNQLSNVDALNRDNWVKTQSSDEKDEYTLYVDSTFF